MRVGKPITEIKENEDGTISYYNLQGLEVSHPGSGELVIKRQGDKTEKIIFK